MNQPIQPLSNAHLPIVVGADDSCPSTMKWFLAGAAFGLVAYPFYAIFLGLPDPKSRRLKRA
jgi:hypothetical protein